MKHRPLILDTDGGVDDAQALIMLVALGRPPVCVTTVFGNVGLGASTDNMLDVLAILSSGIPLHMGADRPLVQPVIDAKHVHGEDGLGGAPRPRHRAEPASRDAVGVLRRMFREAAARGDKVDILMIGPLTNLALALRLEPAILDGIGTLTIMGGTVYGRGNSSPASEFNIFADPEAAQIVFSEPIETIVIPWEPCVTHAMTGDAVDAGIARQPKSAARDFSAALAQHLRNGVKTWTGEDRLRLVDPLAAAVILEPGIVTKSVKAAIQVALAPGITRGMTVLDTFNRFGTPKHTVIEEVDLDRLHDLYLQSTAFSPQRQLETS